MPINTLRPSSIITSHTMSARELVLEHPNGTVTTLAFTETSLTVRSGSITADTPQQHSFLFSCSTKPSQSEIPIRNVIAATVSGSTVEVSYLKGSGKQCLCMKQVRGDVKETDVPLAMEWCSSITQVAYQGSRIADSVYALLCLSCFFLPSFIHLPRSRRSSFKGLEGPH